MLRADWLGVEDGKVGTHITQPQQCHLPSGAADGQWLPSSFSASGKKQEKKAGYQVPIPLSIALPHAMPQSTKDLQPCQGDGFSQDGQLDTQFVPKPAALKEEAPC